MHFQCTHPSYVISFLPAASNRYPALGYGMTWHGIILAARGFLFSLFSNEPREGKGKGGEERDGINGNASGLPIIRDHSSASGWRLMAGPG